MTVADELPCTRIGSVVAIFEFERASAGSRRCLPMIVRLKLDRSGVKLSRRQWVQLSASDREEMAAAACDTVDEIDAYGAMVASLLEVSGDVATRFQIDLDPPWEGGEGPPPDVDLAAREAGLPLPTSLDWARLSLLQRFVLLKLSADGCAHANLRAALREFGLMR